MLLSKWLDYDPKASWDKLANALETMGKNAIAKNIRSKYVGGPPPTTTPENHDHDTNASMSVKILDLAKNM